MTDDQRARLNRFLAEKVLGWKFDQHPPDRTYYCRMAKTLDAPVWSLTPGGKWQCGLCNGGPDFTRWADCEPLLDKIERDGFTWDLRISHNGYYSFVLRKDGGRLFWNDSRSRTEALCLSIGLAYGWKEEA